MTEPLTPELEAEIRQYVADIRESVERRGASLSAAERSQAVLLVEIDRLRAVAQNWASLYSPSGDRPEDRWDRGYACAMRDAARAILASDQDGGAQ